MTASRLQHCKRVVLKIGSSLLADQESGSIREAWLDALCEDVAFWHAQGCEVILVSSGAVAVGRQCLGLPAGVLRLEEKQAAAATGQIRLAHAYQERLARHGVTVAQILLTIDDSENRRRYLNARNTLETLIKLRAVPVINENDTVATQEIRFGDNDRLAARVAQMIGADMLVLFSDIDGLYSADPRKTPNARFIAELEEITPEIEAMAGDPGSSVGSGGMVTKLMAAKIALAAGCGMVIAQGSHPHALRDLLEGGRATWFTPRQSPLTARKTWIAGAIKPVGSLIVDDGAAVALAQGGSLLPAGIVAIEGEFQRGDAVWVKNRAGLVLGKGLSAYAASDARLILGRKSSEIEQILGFRGRDEMIHRDDLVLE